MVSCTAETEWLHGKHVAFGQMTDGTGMVVAMERFGSRNGRTSKITLLTVDSSKKFDFILS